MGQGTSMILTALVSVLRDKGVVSDDDIRHITKPLDLVGLLEGKGLVSSSEVNLRRKILLSSLFGGLDCEKN